MTVRLHPVPNIACKSLCNLLADSWSASASWEEREFSYECRQ